MQPGQVPPNQNFLNRAPGPIPVSHGNVQQQVGRPSRCLHVHAGSYMDFPFPLACFVTLLIQMLPKYFSACLIVNSSLSCFFNTFHFLLLLSDLFCVQSVVVGMPPVSQVSMMEEQQRQNNMVRPN